MSRAAAVVRCKRTTGATVKVGEEYAIKHVIRQTVARLGQPNDIAAAVCFIASPLADFMTGTTIRIDGGATPTV